MGNVEDRDHEHCCHPAPSSHPLNFGTVDLNNKSYDVSHMYSIACLDGFA